MEKRQLQHYALSYSPYINFWHTKCFLCQIQHHVHALDFPLSECQGLFQDMMNMAAIVS